MNSQAFLAGKAEQAFSKAHRADDLSAMVRIARDTARQMILDGGLNGDTDLLEVVDPLAGGPFNALPTTDGSGVIWTDYCHHISAAFAIGVAVGQLVHPDVFKKGGA